MKKLNAGNETKCWLSSNMRLIVTSIAIIVIICLLAISMQMAQKESKLIEIRSGTITVEDVNGVKYNLAINDMDAFNEYFNKEIASESEKNIMVYLGSIAVIFLLMLAIFKLYKIAMYRRDIELNAKAVDNQIVSIHEAGHAVISRILNPDDTIFEISIIPKGKSKGRNKIYECENYSVGKKVLNDIACLFGGKIAEETILGVTSNNSKEDFRVASEIISERTMYSYTLTETPESMKKYDSTLEAKKLSKEAYELAEKVLTENRDKVERLGELLQKKKKLNKDEIEEFFKEFGL